MTTSFHCPSCGGPLDYDGGPDLTIQCPYCMASVIVPEELRRPASLASRAVSLDMDLSSLVGQAVHLKEIVKLTQAGRKIEAIKLYRQLTGQGLKESKDAIDALQAGRSITIPQLADSGAERDASAAAEVRGRLQEITVGSPGMNVDPKVVAAAGTASVTSLSLIGCALAVGILLVTAIPVLYGLSVRGGPLFVPWNRVNPFAFARITYHFGGEGTGPGQFEDPRAIALDAAGKIYVGDFGDGRIQRFSPSGEFQSLWMTDQKAYLSSLAASRDGVVVTVYNGKIWRYNGASGELLGTVETSLENDYFDYAIVTVDGGLVGASRESLVRFAQDGEIAWVAEDILTAATGESDSIAALAADGLGNLYVLATFEDSVFKFSPQGQFITRWGSRGDGKGQFTALTTLAVDHYGRVFVSDIHGIQVFDSQGRYLDRIEVEGVAFGLAFSEKNDLFAVTNADRVYQYQVPAP